MAQMVGQALTRLGCTPVLAAQSPGGSTEDELTEMLVDRGVSGMIFMSGLHADTTADTARYGRLHEHCRSSWSTVIPRRSARRSCRATTAAPWTWP
jgi:hypothetical protein